jgi:uncharacterized membrane protein YhaH (DUF805 family)
VSYGLLLRAVTRRRANNAPVTTPAGWYPDPQTPTAGRQRYWDGSTWTEHVHDPAAPSAYPSAAAPIGMQYPPADTFGFGESVKRAFGKYATFAGRATPREYWWFTLFHALVICVLAVGFVAALVSGLRTTTTVDAAGNTVSVATVSSGSAAMIVVVAILFGLFSLAVLLPGICVSVRRLHDTNRPGTWYWVSFIPLIGGIWLLILLASGGDEGPNQFGPPSTRST